MPSNSPAAGGSQDRASLTGLENLGKGLGRKRYCKKCKFTCTGARQFTDHLATHLELEGSKQNTSALLLQRFVTGNSGPQKTLKSKHNLKNISTKVTSMQEFSSPLKNNSKTVRLTAALTCLNPAQQEDMEMESLSVSPSSASECQEKCLATEEIGDEPDEKTLITSQENSSTDDTAKLPSSVIDSFSDDDDDDDMEDEDRLVIDDDGFRMTATTADDIHSHVYTCHRCEMTTTSAKAYLCHLNNDHNMDLSIHECSLCEFATVYKQKLLSHQKLHSLADAGDQLNSSFDSACKNPEVNANKNTALSDVSFHNLSQQNSSLLAEETDAMEEGDSNTQPKHQISTSTPNKLTSENINHVLDEDKKGKKKTRQEVDPGKYFEAVDSSGTKYACSQCGNIYKWRKSLNKHWKEKHNNDPLVETASPPGMLELLKSGKYTQLGVRRIYDKVFLGTIKASNSDDTSGVASLNNFTRSPSPSTLLNKSKTLPVTVTSLTSPGTALVPKCIGPFVSSTVQPVFPGIPMTLPQLAQLSNGYSTPEEGVLDLSHDGKSSSRKSPYSRMSTTQQVQTTSFDQEQPLDFSKHSQLAKVKTEKLWKDLNSTKPAQSTSKFVLYHCSKCGFACSSEAELTSHTSLHVNKKISKCFECKLQFNSMGELNNHFLKLHFQKLSEYKEAVKKIPHGLQQTHVFLNMGIHDIGELGSQDLGASEGRMWKCNKCDFEAKWPAELQKHAVSHSEERPYICMVCGSTYKWKWDLVKHFQKSHPTLPNPYRRTDKKDSSEDDDRPPEKRAKFEVGENNLNHSLYSRADAMSSDGIIPTTEAGRRYISIQPKIVDGESSNSRNITVPNSYSNTSSGETAQVSREVKVNQTTPDMSKCNKVLNDCQDADRTEYDSVNSTYGSNSHKNNGGRENDSPIPGPEGSRSEELPYKCTKCNYHARWPSEITQHMKNHSDCKPYLCPRCEYRSKWKWDVVKHMKRCGGGGINDVIDTTKSKKKDVPMSCGPPNAVISQQGKVNKVSTQPSDAYVLPSGEKNCQQSTITLCHIRASSNDDLGRLESNSLTQDLSSNSSNNSDCSAANNNFNNNYTDYTSGLPGSSFNPLITTANNISNMGNISLSSNPAHSSSPSSTKTSSSRQSFSGELWNCLHCPFTTQSQAELKRHSVIHADDKPFKCNVCNYETRWAGDIRKHRKSYNHYSINDDRETAEKPNLPFRCSQCAIYFQSLQNLLEHRLAEHVGQESVQCSPATSTDNEIDMARIKHPRKQMRQFQCPKCPFVCKSRQTLEGHMNEHEQLGLNVLLCFYCNSLYKDKESLLDHISTHSDFDPKEWGLFFMISDEEQHQPKVDIKVNQSKDVDEHQTETNKIKNNHDITKIQCEVTENGTITANSTEARIHQILNEIPKQIIASQKSLCPNMFKCEWCPAEFGNLTAVYKHANQVHPVQLKEQDISMVEADQIHLPKLPSDSQDLTKKSYPRNPIDILRQQIEEKRTHQLTEKLFPSYTVKMEQENLNNNTQDEKCANYSCDKCDFSTADFANFQCHCEIHMSKLASECWFCDYSVGQMNLLYQHMKISHTQKWKALSQDPKHAKKIRRIILDSEAASVPGDDSNSGHSQDVVNNSSNNNMSYSDTTNGITYITKLQYTWRGISVNIVSAGSSLNFVCPHCSFQDASITMTCCHVMQSHKALSKFTCKTCQFSDNSINVMSKHCKKEHLLTERIVEVLNFKQFDLSEPQTVHLNALGEQMAHDLSKISEINPDVKMLAAGAMSCPFCPFKTLVTEHMKVHISDHSKQGKYHCQMCDFSSDSTDVISEHVKVHETDYVLDTKSLIQNKGQGTLMKEPVDRKSDTSESKIIAWIHPIREPMELEHNDQEESIRSKINKRIRYRCSVCPYYTSCRNNMVKHMRQHNNNKKYKCSKCSYGASRAALLKKHLDCHETPVEDDGQHHVIFCDPNNPSDNVGNSVDGGHEMDLDDDVDSDDVDEVDAKAIADLEAKDIMKAEAAHKTSVLLTDGDNVEKQLPKQKCPYCPFSSTFGHELRKHLIFHGVQERYKCDYCSYSLDRLNLLSQHRKLHAAEPGYNLNPPPTDLLNTNFIFQQYIEKADPEDLAESADLGEENHELKASQFSCIFCPYIASKKKAFDIHCHSHSLRKCYICDFCDWSTDHMGLLYQHRKVHESEPAYNPSPEDNIFLNQEFDNDAAGEFEAKFMETKSNDKPMMEGKTEVRLSAPFKLTVIKKSYPCKLCPYKTNSRNSYSIHMNMHDSGSEFACNECSYACVNKGLLKQHQQLHTADVSFASSVTVSNVSNMFNSSNPGSNLDPEPVHRGEKKSHQEPERQLKTTSNPELKCQRCPFMASSQMALTDHIRGHISQGNLKCPHCDFNAISRKDMLTHIEIHFPGAKLEEDILDQILETYTKVMNNINHNLNNSESDCSESYSSNPEKSQFVVEKEAVRTKRVYVCQFCEREFESKQLMIQHEKRHLTGSHKKVNV